MQFVDFAPVKLVFGPGRLEALRTEPLPGTRALLLTSNGRSMERIGALARVTAILEERGVAVVHMGVVEPNPTVSTVMKVAARMKDERCDFLVALGGGSVMDCAKISGLMATNPGELWDYVQGGTGGRRAFEHDPLPLVAITTTAGTGSEVDAGGVITNPETREKVGIGHRAASRSSLSSTPNSWSPFRPPSPPTRASTRSSTLSKATWASVRTS